MKVIDGDHGFVSQIANVQVPLIFRLALKVPHRDAVHVTASENCVSYGRLYQACMPEVSVLKISTSQIRI